ncbi:MAG: hypothetical protein CVT66_09075 [Actinobacteria bacterium HGW-Actinobacteria-6]|jgi:hypothetical protein|nr:MAG: hypothetical protein CVT66_09075 [Actinobacteria bacterium HGW-Actinobacteria-6]
MTEDAGTRRVLTVTGVGLVVLGVVLMAFQVWDVDIAAVGWPFVVIIPGVLFLLGAGIGGGQRGFGYLAVPGCIITSAGVLLAYQNFTGDWQSWSYAWAFVAPGAVGLGLLIAGIRESSPGIRRVGVWLAGLGLALALIGEWAFVKVLGVGGPGFGPVIEALLPLALIVAGLYVVFGRGGRSAR